MSVKRIGFMLVLLFASAYVGAMTVENTASGIDRMVSELLELRNGELKTKALAFLESIRSLPDLDLPSRVVMCDAIYRAVGGCVPYVAKEALAQIEQLVPGEFDNGYEAVLWEWLNESGKINKKRRNIGVIRAMIEMLKDSELFRQIRPVLVQEGLSYYMPAVQQTGTFQLTQKGKK